MRCADACNTIFYIDALLTVELFGRCNGHQSATLGKAGKAANFSLPLRAAVPLKDPCSSPSSPTSMSCRPPGRTADGARAAVNDPNCASGTVLESAVPRNLPSPAERGWDLY